MDSFRGESSQSDTFTFLVGEVVVVVLVVGGSGVGWGGGGGFANLNSAVNIPGSDCVELQQSSCKLNQMS